MNPQSDELTIVNHHLRNILEANVDEREFKKSVKTLKRNILHLNKSVALICNSISSINWSMISKNNVSRVLNLVVEIFTAHPVGIKIGLEGLIKSLHALNRDDYESLEEISKTISFIYQLNPSTAKMFIVALESNVPFMNKPKIVHMNYLKFLFILFDDLPSLRSSILAVITYLLIKLDCELSRDDLVKDKELVHRLKRENLQPSDVPPEVLGESSLEYYHAFDKIDDLIPLFIQKLVDYGKENGFETLFDELKSSLTKVLQCQGLLCVQFVWFYLASLDEIFLKKTVKLLLSNINDYVRSINVAHSSSSFLGGLLARNSTITYDVLKRAILRLRKFLIKYMNADTFSIPSDSRMMLDSHRIFYAVSQALFYAVVFRNKFIVASQLKMEWHEFLEKLSLDQFIHSQLNPLIAVSPSISHALAELGKEHQLFYAFTILSKNIRFKSGNEENFKFGVNMMDFSRWCNFPFDPYLLLGSSKQIEKYYSYW